MKMCRSPAAVRRAVCALAALAAAPAAALAQGCDPTVTLCPVNLAPEPATLSLLALAVATLAIARRRK